ncbi:hypothetical protein LX90_001931 [Lentzea flava]|nr:hypothetical protein [Lentzea flava]
MPFAQPRGRALDVHFPQPHRRVVATRGQIRAVGGERDGRDVAVVPRQPGDQPRTRRIGDVPQPQHAVRVRGRHQGPVEGHRVGARGQPGQPARLPCGARVGQPDLLVPDGRGEQPAVRAEAAAQRGVTSSNWSITTRSAVDPAHRASGCGPGEKTSAGLCATTCQIRKRRKHPRKGVRSLSSAVVRRASPGRKTGRSPRPGRRRGRGTAVPARDRPVSRCPRPRAIFAAIVRRHRRTCARTRT